MSEDGATTLTDVRLDGGVETNGSIRTSYREGGFNSDADNHIVHVETFSYGFVWAPIALLIAFFFMFGGMKTIRKHVRRRQRARALRLARKQSA
ncbi:hypothetical protein [Mycetocola sp. BIGb0189]|uniref:hypothetical protein n=1 Tax=Mycetocola sp. BIGb0189 TaxID=2940604 RepID=UPI002166FF9F|nr:hypothetical protein [Mycetocola sp. BIGb0189]